MQTQITITHRPTGEVLAQGPKGWGFFPFEGNYYIRRRYLKTQGFRPSFMPGFCIYKFFYIWLNLKLKNGFQEGLIAWMYVLPNPLMPFIWFRIALPQSHPALAIQVEPIGSHQGKYLLNQNR